MRSAFARTLPLLLLGIASGPLAAGELTARLVRDIDSTSYAGSSRPRDLQPVPWGYVFTAFGGRELWIINTRDGTVHAELHRPQIRTLAPSLWAAREESGGWSLWSLYAFRLGAWLEPVAGEPFRSVRRAARDASGFGPALIEADRGSGTALWLQTWQRTVVEIARPWPLADGSLVRDVTWLYNDWENQRTLFVARDRRGAAIWATDGTARGTQVILAPGLEEGALAILGVVGGKALISVAATGRCRTAELWASDGTPAGTTPLAEIVGGDGCALVSGVVTDGGGAFLLVDDRDHGRELWISDGTSAGTERLTSLAPDDPFGALELSRLTSRHGYLFFADDGNHGREPWLTDGTPGGTRLLADLCPGPCASTGAALGTVYRGDTGDPELLFAARVRGLGRELWTTDGTTAGTRLLADLCPGPCNGDPADLFASPTSSLAAYFNAVTADGERAQFVTDGTPAGTVRLTSPGVSVTRGAAHGGTFAATEPTFGEELWQTYGTPATTGLWYDLERERSSGSYPIPLGVAGERLVFSAVGPAPLRALWSSDGTEPGTVPLTGRAPRRAEGYDAATVGGRTLIVGLPHGRASGALWASNGLPGGTVRLTPPGVEVRSPLRAVGKRAFFLALDPGHGTELWVSDGRPGGTHLVADLTPGPAGTDFHPVLAALGGRLLFRRYDDHWHLWLSDGSAAGTHRLLEVYPFLLPLERGAGYEIPLAELDGKLVFPGVDAAGANRVFVSDGTARGTAPLIAGPADLRLALATRNRFYLVAGAPDAEVEYATALWVSDGTPAGTTRLASRLPDQGFPPVLLDDGLLFSGGFNAIWATDGTVEGTAPLHDADGAEIPSDSARAAWFGGRAVLASGYGLGPCLSWAPGEPFAQPIPSAPLCGGSFAPVGSRLYFSGFTPTTGTELWVLEAR